MGNLKDFATGIVVTAPSPSNSGLSLTLQTGEGARMPTVPFSATAHPATEMPTIDNSERITVTAVTGDVLTIVRAQGVATAKNISAGWRISNSLFEDDIISDHTELTNIGTNTHTVIDTKLASLINEREITKESTGFTNCDDIVVTYNDTNRTITLTGTFEAYHRGEKIAELVNGWVSPAHAAGQGTYFLYYCDDTNSIVFDTTPWRFDCLQIAYVQVNGHTMALRETHGFMPWTVHEELHQVVGTYRVNGGEVPSNSYTLNSTVAADRRPDVNQTIVKDEDLQSTITALTSKAYTQRYLSGSTPDRMFTQDATDIIALNGNIPYYNQNVAGTWQQTPMSNNEYAAIFIVAIPTTDDTLSKKMRYLFVQPQQVGTLLDIQALTPNNLTHGVSSLLVSEFVFMGKIIINMSGNNWTLTSVELLSGTRLGQVSSVTGNYLTAVNHDTTLTGSGTALDPLSVVQQTATTVANTPAGNIAATTVQAAINELDSEKALLAGNTAQSFSASTIDLGHTTDTTIARVSAGLISVEGKTLIDDSTAQTAANKVVTNVSTSAPATPADGMLWWDTDDATVQAVNINIYKARVGLSSGNQTIGASYTPSVVAINSEFFDTNNNFNDGTYTYTVPVTGYYQISGSVRFSSTGAAECGMGVAQNGSLLIGSFGTHYAAGQYDTLNTSGLCYLTAGDAITLTIYGAGGAVVYPVNSQTFLSIKLDSL